MRYLIVTQDPVYGHHLSTLLQADGNVVDCLTGGLAPGPLNRQYLRDYAVEGVVLDLSTQSPFQEERWLHLWRRDCGGDVPVVVVAGDVWGAVRCLKNGADGCHLRGDEARILAARLAALLRRRQGFCSDELVVPPFRLWLRLGALSVDGHPVVLTQLEFQVLAVLMRHRGRVLTRNAIWLRLRQEVPSAERGRTTLDVIVGRIRQKLSRCLPAPETYLRTVRGVGFMFSPPGPPPALPGQPDVTVRSGVRTRHAPERWGRKARQCGWSWCAGESRAVKAG